LADLHLRNNVWAASKALGCKALK